MAPFARGFCTWLAMFMLLGAASSAWASPPLHETDAETRSAARHLAKQAMQLMDQERWHDAQELLHRAYALVPAPTIANLEGVALERLGRLVEAADCYELARIALADTSRPAAFVEAAQHADQRLNALLPRIPRLRVVITGVEADDDELRVSIDDGPLSKALLGSAVAQPINPGRHVVRASYAGEPVASTEITLREGEEQSVALDVVPRRREGSLRRTLGWTSVGIGVAGAVTGIVAGAVMLDRKSTLDERCNPTCPESARDALSTFRTARTVSLVGWGFGIGGLAVGTTLLLTSSASENPVLAPRVARLDAVVGPTSIALRGTF